MYLIPVLTHINICGYFCNHKYLWLWSIYTIDNFLFKMPSPSGKTQRPHIALMLNDRWFVYWGSLIYQFGSPLLCWGIFLSLSSFAHKKFASIHLFFDFVKTRIKWLHRLVFSFETYFEKSCRSMKWVWNFLLGVSGAIFCNVHAGGFGVWSLNQCDV